MGCRINSIITGISRKDYDRSLEMYPLLVVNNICASLDNLEQYVPRIPVL